MWHRRVPHCVSYRKARLACQVLERLNVVLPVGGPIGTADVFPTTTTDALADYFATFERNQTDPRLDRSAAVLCALVEARKIGTKGATIAAVVAKMS